MTPRPAGSAPQSEAVESAGSPLPPPVGSAATAWIVAGAAGLAFAVLSAWIAERGPAVPWIDLTIHRWVLADRGRITVRIANDLRWAGATETVLPALVLVGAAAPRAGSGWARRAASGVLLAAVAGAGVLAEIWVNHVIGRVRPPVADWAGAASGASFPSGHATNATLFALACGWAWTGRIRPGWRRRAVWAGAAVYPGAVGWSRVWLGVHWPTDVLGGWLFGLAWMAGAAAVVLSLRRRPAPTG